MARSKIDTPALVEGSYQLARGTQRTREVKNRQRALLQAIHTGLSKVLHL
jgi:hypothetical protein